ncbi:MAG: hypothetical protein J6586_03920, partial [Snodgrassella sp.]|nr:hypothetical protein [Snodgrassella sp.]
GVTTSSPLKRKISSSKFEVAKLDEVVANRKSRHNILTPGEVLPKDIQTNWFLMTRNYCQNSFRFLRRAYHIEFESKG